MAQESLHCCPTSTGAPGTTKQKVPERQDFPPASTWQQVHLGRVAAGRVAEWLKAAVLKTAEVQNASGGSNPSSPARRR